MPIRILSFYGIAIALGVLTGLMGSLFQLAIRAINWLMATGLSGFDFQSWSGGFVSAIISILMVFIAWLLVKRFSPEASGSGVQEIEGRLLHERPLLWRRLLPVKFIGGVLAISSKMALGREGPTIQMGGNLGDMLSEWFHCDPKQSDALIAAGSAAGLAAAFNAPLAGILFVLEEMRSQFDFSFINFKAVAICCVISTVVMQLILGSQPAINMSAFNLPSLNSLWLFFIFGIVVGFAGLIFNLVLITSLNKMDTFSPMVLRFYVIIVALVIGFLAWYEPVLVGGGYAVIEQSLTMGLSFSVLIVLLLIRFLLSIVCYCTGVPGGVFAPILALGTLLGMAFSSISQYLTVDMSVHPGMFAVAGMGALFSATVRAPITGIVLVVEMTQNYSLILPLMITCLTSTTIMQLAGNPPLYTQLLKRTLLYKGNV